MNSKLEEMNLHDLFFILRKHLLLIIVVSVLCGIAGFAATKFLIPPQYEAQAKLIVNTDSTMANAAEVYDAVQLSQKEVDTYAIIMKNNTILNHVIQDLSLGISRDQLAKKIDIKGEGTTEVLDLSVKTSSPVLANSIAAEIIKYAPAEIIRTVKAGSVEVISPPVADPKPVSPNVRMYTAVAFVVGIIVSVLIAFLMETLNNTFTSDDDVQKYLGYSVIGVIPNIELKRKGTK